MAGAVSLALTFGLRLVGVSGYLPEVALQALIANLPASVESSSIGLMGGYAKYVGFLASNLVAVCLYGLLGIFFFSRYSRTRHSAWTGLGFGVGIGLVASAIFFNFLAFSPISGRPLEDAMLFLSGTVVGNAVFGVILHLAKGRLQALIPKVVTCEPAGVWSKRLFIRKGVAGLIGLTVLAILVDRFLIRDLLSGQREVPPSRATGVVRTPQDIFLNPALTSLTAAEVTNNQKFYVVSKNFIDPAVGLDGWALKVDGLVKEKRSFTYDEIKSLPSQKQFTTLTCISNPVGGDLISNAEWTGVQLSLILGRAQAMPEATEVAFYCADGYSDSIPIEKANRPDVILAYLMSGVPLPKEHGFPLRLIVPGLYGMKNPKWINRIELVNYDFRGYWETRGWVKDAVAKTVSRIDLPPQGSTVQGITPIAGIAFAGDRGIEKVQVSLDGGATWKDALVKEPRSKYSWVLWAAEWEPEGSGHQSIIVRALDGKGNVQAFQTTDVFPSGATGYHKLLVTVSKPS